MSDSELRSVHDGVQPTTKRSLLVLSHAMERAFDLEPPPAARQPGGTRAGAAPPLMLALFQRREYFDREAARYADLARSGATVIVGFVGPLDGVPDGVHAVGLDEGDPLAAEWALVLLRGVYGSSLSAVDELSLGQGELTLQASRLFHARWTFRRQQAVDDAQRLLRLLTARLAVAVVAAAHRQIAAAAALPVSDVEAQLAAAADHLMTSLEVGHRRAVRLRVALDDSRVLAERDQLTGLHNRHYLERFLGSPGDPAALAVLLVDIDNLKAVNDRFGHLAGDAVITAIARTLWRHARPGDVVVRWGGDEFLLLVPGLPGAAAVAFAEQLADQVRHASAVEPWDSLPLSASISVGVTARAVLPLDELDAALYSVKRGAKGRVALATNAAVP